jgi:tRNA dimethylallyltransferase
MQIDEIRSRGKLPILVGGTHYYTQSLLFKDALSDEPGLENEKKQQNGRFPILDEPTEIILEKLKEVDPIMADRWHLNDRRKIQRSLEIYLKTGKPASQVYDEQRLRREIASSATEDGESPVGLRFPTLLLWVHTSKDVLVPRLDGRIDKMIQKGLLSEVQTLSDFAASHEKCTGSKVDLGRGIWVSIGYKEFSDYQAALSNPSISESDLTKLRLEAVEKTQAATRQYAKRQIRWIQIKLLNALIAAGRGTNMFLVDGSDLSRWDEAVIRPSVDATQQFLAGEALPSPIEVSPIAREMLAPKRDYDLAQRPDLWEKKSCEACGTVAVTPNDWHLHIKSRAHRRAIAAKKKQEHACNSQAKEHVVVPDPADFLDGSLDSFPNEKNK